MGQFVPGKEGDRVGVRTYAHTHTIIHIHMPSTAQVCCKGLTSFEFEVYVSGQQKNLKEHTIRHNDNITFP